jgi:prolyl-tRNA editing enzyme YbaK/EbsC (Cys-tRNA(Pro) deacylase)
LSGQDERNANSGWTWDQVRVARVSGGSSRFVCGNSGGKNRLPIRAGLQDPCRAQGDRKGICLAIISAQKELDFRALAQQTGDRKVDMVPLKEVQAVTGYIRSGVTALACKRDYPVYFDQLAEICDVISVSAGMRGMQILLAPEDYIRAVNAKVAAIAKSK